MDKILTIVIPTYNMEKYLDRCLSSLIVNDNLMERLDVLVVNDGSKDRSSEIAHKYGNRFPQTFRVIDKENGNYGSCINAALLVAEGKYIKILDADDYFDNKALVDYLSLLNSVDVDFVFNGMSMVNESDFVIDNYCFEDRLGKYKTLPFKDYAINMNGAGVYMQNVAYRLDCLKSMNYHQTEDISYTDQEWLFIPLYAMKSVAYFPKSLYMYLVGRSGQTVNAETHMKNMWMEIAVTKSLVNSYVSRKDDIEKCPVEIRRYIFGRVMSRVRFVYSTYLLSGRNRLDNGELVEFDEFLHSVDCCLYDMADNISARFGIKYVKIWRKDYSFNHLLYKAISFKQSLARHKYK